MAWEFDFLYALQEIHNPILDELMTFVSMLGNAGLLWIGLAIVLLCIPKTRKCGGQMALSMLLTFIIGNLILKNVVARERPCWIDDTIPLLLNSPVDYSFPSGHTMNGFTAALTLFFYNKKWGTVALILAAVIAFSRLYHFVHFPTDVLAGIVIGVVSAVVMQKIFQYWSQRKKNSK